MSSILIKNIKSLVQICDGKQLVRGTEMQKLPTIDNAFLLIENDKIADFGAMEKAPDRAEKEIDATDKMVFPSFCDSHTHLVFAASREEEFVDRIKGLSYEEMSAKGGGILNSARKLQQTSEEKLYDQALERLGEAIQFGTGAIEIKSGYGLTLDSELKILRVIRKLKENTNAIIKATFLGAHSIPMKYRSNRSAYVDLVINEMLPKVVDEGLADYIDVFCEKVAFSIEETERILEAGAKYGLPAKIHTNQFYSLGGIETAIKFGAKSVDHLEVLTDEEIDLLKNSKTIPTLLPTAPFFLNQDHTPPARKMIEKGLGVALATDFNPGTTPSVKMSFVLSLGCIKLRMLPEETINAATINGAVAMDVENEVGSIAKGKVANLFISKKIPSINYFPYSFGSDLVDKVILRGEVL